MLISWKYNDIVSHPQYHISSHLKAMYLGSLNRYMGNCEFRSCETASGQPEVRLELS